ncbi:MAG TPA: PIN domain-containing protein [Allosphingosinicella sp.]|jgi:predicted nucleic acid-binding protein
MARISLDTNILVYALDRGAGEKNRIARRVVRAAAEAEGVLTQQVIGEFLNVSRKVPGLNHQRLSRIAAGLCATFPILPTSQAQVFEAFDRAARYRIQFWDSVIATVCLGGAVSHLVTEDLQDGLVLDGLIVINPFNPANGPALDALLADAPPAP